VFVVVFEVLPKPDRVDDYLGLAQALKPALEASAGFLEIERFRSTTVSGRILSVSTWRDEKALVRWRVHAAHHVAQERGRFEIFADYHLRIGETVADTAPPPGVPVAEQRFDETEVGEAKACTITELPAGRDVALDTNAAGLVDHDLYESIYQPGKRLILASWRSKADAGDWRVAAAGVRQRIVRIIRDYGMFERREAPQFYPAVARR
jgi:heme-degrading monooxygenase HmoA